MPIQDTLSIAVIAVVVLLAVTILAYQFVTGVPPMPSTRRERADVVALLKEADIDEQAVIYELGSGWGTLVIALAKAFPDAQVRGFELSPLPYWVARLRTRKMANVRLTRGNFFNADLRDADAVVCYLMVKPMPRVAALLDRTLEPGTPVVSIAFSFRDRLETAVREGKWLRGKVSLYFWPAPRRG